ncbi:MAG: DUF2268 domain-containing putative Zn-dependent protease [Candidatus Pacearchaeota archaeon]
MIYEIKSDKGVLVAEIHFLTDRKEIKNSKVTRLIKEALLKCYKEIPLKNKKVAVFYTDYKFIKDKMGGVGGNALHENLISLYINPSNKKWKDRLESFIVHEYSHLTVFDKRKWKTIEDSLIIEGIAEVFRDEIVGGKPSPWTSALTEKEAKDLLKKIKNKLKTPVEKMHKELFFGSKEFKMWSGYSLGYQIVKSFRKKYPELSWKKIIKMKSSEILKKSEF